MKTISQGSASGWLAAAAVGAAALLAAGAAQARDVHWSIGINSPGVAVGVGNGYPVYVAPAPVYVPPRPVYYAPPPPVYYAPPRPIYYSAPPVVVQPYGYYERPYRHHRHHRHHKHWDD
ncbi:hypothetical protein [Acidovorax lacteus]|uniref:Virulence factor n=1 Tax=Acidovorax lacteus TaxID=1924988 RepID=A0ABP8L0K3_9BURK